MERDNVGHSLSLGVLAVAAFSSLAGLSLPVAERKPSLMAVAAVFALLIAHSALYWFGASLRSRFGVGRYVAAQVMLVFGASFLGGLFPVGTALYIALTAHTVLLAEKTWGSVPITLGAILIFAANAIAARDLYQGATAGLLLAATGVVTHAIAGLVSRRSRLAESSREQIASPAPRHRESFDLTTRELEVLRAVASGARSSDIAVELRITERTVKSHLASIYQKLGVKSRAAAVALAVQRDLV
jgi:DNA-binding CsgD family transcriptional regulator